MRNCENRDVRYWPESEVGKRSLFRRSWGVDQTSFKGAKIDTIDPKGDTANTVFSVNEISLESVKLRVTATAEIVGEESS